MDPRIAKVYGNQLRLRVCGLQWENDRLLLVNHRMEMGVDFWSPPGGGVEYGERLEQALRREFHEETGLEVRMGKFLFGCEFMESPLHAVELFFEVHRVGGELKKGYDPEIQIIQDVRYLVAAEIAALPGREKHGIFQLAQDPETLLSLSGFYGI